MIGERTLTLRDHFGSQEGPEANEENRNKPRDDSKMSQFSQFSNNQKPVFRDSILDEENSQLEKDYN